VKFCEKVYLTHGIDGNLLNWVEEWLRGKRPWQWVGIGCSVLEWENVICGSDHCCFLSTLTTSTTESRVGF